MAKKILLASGCSYTDPNYKSNDPGQIADWPMWPELIAKELGLECINKGSSGRGSDHIFDTILEGIATYGDRIDTVAILWSTSDRLPIFDLTLNPIMECYIEKAMEKTPGIEDPFRWLDDLGIGRISKGYFNSDHFVAASVYKFMIENTLKKMYAILEICEKQNIKLIMFEGLTYFDFRTLNFLVDEGILPNNCRISGNQVAKFFMNNPYFPKIEKKKKHIIGWPILQHLGGYSFDDIRCNKEEYHISEIDRHPNKAGQEMIAKYFMEKHNDLYPH